VGAGGQVEGGDLLVCGLVALDVAGGDVEGGVGDPDRVALLGDDLADSAAHEWQKVQLHSADGGGDVGQPAAGRVDDDDWCSGATDGCHGHGGYRIDQVIDASVVRESVSPSLGSGADVQSDQSLRAEAGLGGDDDVVVDGHDSAG
jgi:hypothetical protein